MLTEMAGEVCELGPGCKTAKIGDRVMSILPGGGYAEFVNVPEELLIPVPAGMDWVQVSLHRFLQTF